MVDEDLRLVEIRKKSKNIQEDSPGGEIIISRYDPSIHHRRSIRLQGYDYSQFGAYFVTICIHDRIYLFGDIVDGNIRLNEFGLLVQMEWQRLSKRFPLVKIDVFSIMPNHIHAILIITDPREVGARQKQNGMTGGLILASPLRQVPTLDVILGAFKSTTTRLINGLQHTPDQPVWQRNYYEHVIRDEDDYLRIAEYIQENPRRWETDELFAK